MERLSLSNIAFNGYGEFTAIERQVAFPLTQPSARD